MTDRELMQQALDALANFDLDVRLKVIPALRARLAQPDLITHADVEQLARIEKLVEDVDPYTAPPQRECADSVHDRREWQGLTTQEIADETDIATSSNKDIFDIRKAFWCGARWAEAKLKGKNA